MKAESGFDAVQLNIGCRLLCPACTEIACYEQTRVKQVGISNLLPGLISGCYKRRSSEKGHVGITQEILRRSKFDLVECPRRQRHADGLLKSVETNIVVP